MVNTRDLTFNLAGKAICQDWSKDELMSRIHQLETELDELKNPKPTPLTMAEVHKLLLAAGWHSHDGANRFGRGLQRMTVTFSNGVFRWAWVNGQRVLDFNELLTVEK